MITLVVVVLGLLPAGLQAQSGAAALDRLLDLYVRDGLVYYAALKSDRATLDRFVREIASEPAGFSSWSPEAAMAFWLNAYNALVLETVIDHYPIRGQAPEYPSNSIRQIPGAFDGRSHQVAGRTVTLDDIETGELAGFDDPRVFLALGRGAVSSGRLRSEVYVAERLEEQLQAVVAEVATLPRYVTLDRLTEEVRVSAIFGWRAAEFSRAYGDPDTNGSGRTAIERAIIALVEPELFPRERLFLAANEFTLRYQEFDWRLNDLTGGRPPGR